MKNLISSILFMLANILAYPVLLFWDGKYLLYTSYAEHKDTIFQVLLVLMCVSFALAYILENLVGQKKKNRSIQQVRWVFGSLYTLEINYITLMYGNSAPPDNFYGPDGRVVLIYSIPAFIYFVYRLMLKRK